MASIEPVSPDLPTKHLVDKLTDERLEGAPEGRQAVIVSYRRSIGHNGELVTVCIEEPLHRLERAHVVPGAVGLGSKIVDVPDMASLLARELRVLGDIEAWDWLRGEG